MQRRVFIGLVAGAALDVPLLSTAHAQRRVYQIGRFMLGPSNPVSALADDAWLEGMRMLGYREGDNMVVHRVRADGGTELIAEKATELIRMKLDVIVTTGNQLPLALRKASRTVPIVVAGTSDGVEAGLWDSHSRPEGNVTGIDNRSQDLDIKHVEIAKETQTWKAGCTLH